MGIWKSQVCIHEDCMATGCIGKSKTNNLPGWIIYQEIPQVKKNLFFKNATQKSASMVKWGIAELLKWGIARHAPRCAAWKSAPSKYDDRTTPGGAQPDKLGYGPYMMTPVLDTRWSIKQTFFYLYHGICKQCKLLVNSITANCANVNGCKV
jgi:hypothetical protein